MLEFNHLDTRMTSQETKNEKEVPLIYLDWNYSR